MQSQPLQKAIFLDRDGVINHDPGDYTKSVDEFTILPTVISTLAHWHQLGYVFIVITNQAGIAKQLYTHQHVQAIHQYFQGQCIAHGFSILDFYYCPHHPQYTGRCLCRKPQWLMLQKAIHKHHINPATSYLIGDKERDIQAAAQAGIQGILIETNKAIHPHLLPIN